MEPPAIAFRDAVIVWMRIALLSFGGPAGQIAVMHRILVDEKKWIDEARFVHALNFCMLLPGPEAQQLATYIGWLLHRVKGGLVAGLLFILPGMIAIMALSWAYVLYGRLATFSAMLLGLKAAVVAILFQAVTRIGRRTLKDSRRVAIAAAAFLAIALFDLPFPIVVLAAALLGWRLCTSAPPADGGQDPAPSPRMVVLPVILAILWLLPLALLPPGIWQDLSLFFSKLAVVTFGGAYAVLAYVGQAAVEQYHWLSAQEMLDGLGLAETTPGPLIMVTQFVGFLAAYRNPGALDPMLAGTLGGLLTTWVTFTPCFLWIFLGAPHVERLRHNRALAAALAGITAAVVGVILSLGVWFAIHFIWPDGTTDWRAALLSAAALVAVRRFNIGTLPLIGGALVAGLLIS